jgi:PKD repeat protein
MPGTYTLTLRAENCGGPLTVTHVITISSLCPRPLTGVGITGPTSGITDTSYTFTGIVAPANASEPITYTWSPAPLSGQGSSSAVYRWTGLGLYTLTLRAENCGGVLTATHTIAIETRQPALVCLPLILKSVSADAPDVCPGWQLSIGEPFDEDFDHSNDADWFTFQATAGVSYTVRTEDLQIHADTVITLYDGTCTTLLRTNDDLSNILNSRASQVAWLADTTGPLRILVRSYEPETFGPDTGYSLVVYDEDHPAPPIQDVPDFCSAAHSIPIGQFYAEDFDYVNDNDWFVFDVAAGRTYTITTSNLAARANTVLELWSGDCLTQLAFNDDASPPDLASQIIWTATEGGRVSFKVRQFDWTIYGPDTGYTVVVEEE